MSQSRAKIGPLLLLAWTSLVAGCGEDRAPMLHRMTRYAGVIRITKAGGSTVAYDLAFDRGNGNLQVKRTDGNRVVTIVRGGDGEPSAFEDAMERPATAAEVAQFELVRDLTDLRTLDGLRAGVPSYSVLRRGVWYVVELESQAGTRIHGHPR